MVLGFCMCVLFILRRCPGLSVAQGSLKLYCYTAQFCWMTLSSLSADTHAPFLGHVAVVEHSYPGAGTPDTEEGPLCSRNHFVILCEPLCHLMWQSAGDPYDRAMTAVEGSRYGGPHIILCLPITRDDISPWGREKWHGREDKSFFHHGEILCCLC